MPRQITADQVARTATDGFKRVNGRMHSLEGRLSRVEGISRVPSPNDVSVPGTRMGIGRDEFSFFRAAKMISALKKGGMSRHEATRFADAGHEMAVFQETAKKRAALSSDSDPLGAFLIPTEVGGPFIEYLYSKQIMQALGAIVLNGLVGEVVVPAQTDVATAYWVGANEAPTESNPTVGQKKLRPKKVGALVKIDNTLMKQAVNPGIEQLVRDDMAKVMGLKMDLAYFFGTGGDNMPLGLWETPGFDKTTVETDATNGTDLTFLHLLSLEGVIEDSDIDGEIRLAMNPKNRRVLKKERIAQFSGDTEGSYVVPPIINNQLLEDMLGMPISVTTQFPINLVKGSASDCSPVIAGVWEEAVIGFWQNIELRASEEAGDASGGAFAQDQTWIRAFAETDFMVRHIEAFAGIADASTVNA